MHRLASLTFALLTVSSVASAQERNANTPPPPPRAAAQPRIAHAGTPTPPPQPVQPAPAPFYYYYYNQQPYYSQYGNTTTYVTQGAPYLVLSDGSVVVNFGYGYERVLRPCAPVRNVAPADPWARDALGRIPEPPGIASLRYGTRGTMAGTPPAQTAQACYRLNAQGAPEVVTVTGY